jgi:hypothetical protein
VIETGELPQHPKPDRVPGCDNIAPPAPKMVTINGKTEPLADYLKRLDAEHENDTSA